MKEVHLCFSTRIPSVCSTCIDQQQLRLKFKQLWQPLASDRVHVEKMVFAFYYEDKQKWKPMKEDANVALNAAYLERSPLARWTHAYRSPWNNKVKTTLYIADLEEMTQTNPDSTKVRNIKGWLKSDGTTEFNFAVNPMPPPTPPAPGPQGPTAAPGSEPQGPTAPAGDSQVHSQGAPPPGAPAPSTPGSTMDGGSQVHSQDGQYTHITGMVEQAILVEQGEALQDMIAHGNVPGALAADVAIGRGPEPGDDGQQGVGTTPSFGGDTVSSQELGSEVDGMLFGSVPLSATGADTSSAPPSEGRRVYMAPLECTVWPAPVPNLKRTSTSNWGGGAGKKGWSGSDQGNAGYSNWGKGAWEKDKDKASDAWNSENDPWSQKQSCNEQSSGSTPTNKQAVEETSAAQ